MQLFSFVMAGLLMVATACAPRGPIVDTTPKAEAAPGTISGLVRESGSATPLTGRIVTATEVSTGQRYQASTATNGGYTIKVPIGRYRVEVELREGESLAEGPSETDVNASDMDAGRDFTVTVKRPG